MIFEDSMDVFIEAYFCKGALITTFKGEILLVTSEGLQMQLGGMESGKS